MEIVLPAVGFAVWAVHSYVQQADRQPPNYSQIDDGLWMGGDVDEPPPGTRAVLNLCERDDPYRRDVHRWEPIPDAGPAPSLEWLRRMVAFISEQRQAGAVVYVHCRAGISRSGMVVAAYLMSKYGWTRDETLAFMRVRRPLVRPNPAFTQLLAEWEEALKDSRTRGERTSDGMR
jgi:hypothetical protein